MVWHAPQVRGEPPAPRSGHVACCLDGNRVLIHGGWDPTRGEPSGPVLFDDLAILDTEAWVWSRPSVKGSQPSARVGHSLASVSRTDGEGGALLLFGGRAEGETPLDELYQLRPVVPSGPPPLSSPASGEAGAEARGWRWGAVGAERSTMEELARDGVWLRDRGRRT